METRYADLKSDVNSRDLRGPSLALLVCFKPPRKPPTPPPGTKRNAGIPVMPRPSTSAWTSCVPSRVLTASRFMQWRMTWYSSWMPFPPRISAGPCNVQRLAAGVSLQ